MGAPKRPGRSDLTAWQRSGVSRKVLLSQHPKADMPATPASNLRFSSLPLNATSSSFSDHLDVMKLGVQAFGGGLLESQTRLTRRLGKV